MNKEKYPCKACIVLPCCTQRCGKLETYNIELQKSFLKGICPDCENNVFLTNQYAAGVYVKCIRCNHYFHLYPTKKLHYGTTIYIGAERLERHRNYLQTKYEVGVGYMKEPVRIDGSQIRNLLSVIEKQHYTVD